MHFITTFVALLALTPALCAPVPAPETVDSLAASNKAEVLIQKMGPMADELVALLKEFGVSAPTNTRAAVQSPPPVPSPSQTASSTTTTGPAAGAAPSPTPDPAAPSADDKANPDPAAAAASPPPAEAETPSPTSVDTPDNAAASPAPTDAPAEDPAAGTVQRRDVTSASEPAPTSTAPSSPAPSATHKIESAKVLKLRQLLAKLTMYEQAIETILLRNGQNIEPIPSAKTAGGMAWGLINGPLMAVLGAGRISKQP